MNNNNKKGRRLKIAVAVLSILLAASIITWITYGSQLQQEKEKNWLWVLNTAGTGYTATTEAFMITGEEWKITWTFTGYVDGATCEVIVYDAYTDSKVRTLSLTDDQDHGFLNFSGRFYLKLRFAGNLEHWTVTVTEYR